MFAEDNMSEEEEQKIFDEALNHPKGESCRMWHKAIGKENQDTKKQQVWWKFYALKLIM